MKTPPQAPKTLHSPLNGTLHLPMTAAANMWIYKAGNAVTYKPARRKAVAMAVPAVR